MTKNEKKGAATMVFGNVRKSVARPVKPTVQVNRTGTRTMTVKIRSQVTMAPELAELLVMRFPARYYHELESMLSGCYPDDRPLITGILDFLQEKIERSQNRSCVAVDELCPEDSVSVTSDAHRKGMNVSCTDGSHSKAGESVCEILFELSSYCGKVIAGNKKLDETMFCIRSEAARLKAACDNGDASGVLNQLRFFVSEAKSAEYISRLETALRASGVRHGAKCK